MSRVLLGLGLLLAAAACRTPPAAGGAEPAQPAVQRDAGTGSTEGAELAAGDRAGLGAIDFYRDHVGHQWGFHCDFDPSCSAFGRRAVAGYGLVPGVLMTADRLLRDHPWARWTYARSADGARTLDPVADNALFAPRARAAGARGAPASDERELAAAVAQVASADVGDGDALFRFASELEEQGEWERARIEYRRYRFLHPTGEHVHGARRGEAICLGLLGRPADALEAARFLPARERRLLEAWIHHAAGEPGRAATAAEEGAGDEARLLAGMYALEADDVERARASFRGLPDPERGELLARADAYEALPSRSPTVAALLSAALPGAGQAWAGRRSDAAVAFFVNAVLITGVAAAASNDEEVTAGALGVLALGFYAGNVYGGANAAQRFNRNERARFLDRTRGMLRASHVGLGVRETEQGRALELYLRF